MEKKEIKQCKGYYITEDGKIYNSKDNQLKTFKNTVGYETVEINEMYYTVAYLVARAFIENQGCMLVGYKDGDITNVCVDNLYWYYQGELDSGDDKKLYELNEQGEIIKEYESLKATVKGAHVSLSTLQTRLVTHDIIITKTNQILCKSERYDKYTIVDKIAKERQHLEELKATGGTHTKKVIEIDNEGNIINKYLSATIAANEKELNYRTIVNNIRKDCYYITDEDTIMTYEEIMKEKGIRTIIQAKKDKVSLSVNKTNNKTRQGSTTVKTFKKEVVIIDKRGEVIRRWNRIKDAAESLNIKPMMISNAFKNHKYYRTTDNENLICLTTNLSQIRRHLDEIFDTDIIIGQYEIVECDEQGKEIERYKSLHTVSKKLGIIYQTLRYRIVEKGVYIDKNGHAYMTADNYDNEEKRERIMNIMKKNNDCFVVECDKAGKLIATYKDMREIRKRLGREDFFIQYTMPREGIYQCKDGTVFMTYTSYIDDEQREKRLKKVKV